MYCTADTEFKVTEPGPTHHRDHSMAGVQFHSVMGFGWNGFRDPTSDHVCSEPAQVFSYQVEIDLLRTHRDIHLLIPSPLSYRPDMDISESDVRPAPLPADHLPGKEGLNPHESGDIRLVRAREHGFCRAHLRDPTSNQNRVVTPLSANKARKS